MYKVQIQQSWMGEREEGKNNRRSVEFILDTQLPFAPYVGMRWEDNKKLINILLQHVGWLGDENMFVIKVHRSNVDKEEMENFIKAAENAGWKVEE